MGKKPWTIDTIKQHFGFINFNGGLSKEEQERQYEYTLKHDNIKENFCKCNNIKLIRISYKDIKTNKYKDIINNLL